MAVVKKKGDYLHSKEGYANLSKYQRDTFTFIVPAVLQAVESVQAVQDLPTFTVVDYGAANGFNSITLINACAEKLQYGTNDFNWVLNDVHTVNRDTLQKLKDKLRSEMAEPDVCPVNVQFVTGSFFNQRVPDSSVHLGVSMNAVHWLSQRPPKNCNPHPEYPDDVTNRILAQDWEDFLLARSRELKSGGRLVIGVHAQPTVPVLKENLEVVALDAVMKSMLIDGIITEVEYQHVRVFPYGRRSKDDLAAPFISASRVNESLKLIQIRTYNIPDSFYSEWVNTSGKEADDKCVQQYLNLLKSFCNSFWGMLISTRGKREYLKILDIFYKRVQQFLEENLGLYTERVFMSVVEVVKR